MTRFLLPVFTVSLLALAAACTPRIKTVFPAVEGAAIDVSTGWAIEGASVGGDRTEETAVTDEDGRFALQLVTAVDTSIPLPASGVYRDTVVIEAQVDGARAYGPADFISIAEVATAPVTLFMIGHEANFDAGTIPNTCELTDPETYALQMLGLDDKTVLTARLSDDMEYAFSLEAWLDHTLVRALPKRCDVPLAQLMTWIDKIAALSPQ